MNTRPEVPFPVDPGFAWEAVKDGDWSIHPDDIGGLTCRGVRGHDAPAVAVLYRKYWRSGGIGQRRYGYCVEHMYGRWIEDGEVRMWRLVHVDR